MSVQNVHRVPLSEAAHRQTSKLSALLRTRWAFLLIPALIVITAPALTSCILAGAASLQAPLASPSANTSLLALASSVSMPVASEDKSNDERLRRSGPAAGPAPQVQAPIRNGTLLSSIIAFAFMAAAFFLFDRTRVARPTKEILDVIDRIAAGDLKARASEVGSDELVQLARAVNGMASSLEEAHASAEASLIKRAAMERRLQRAQVLAAVSSTAELVAHEIGSPLNTILGRARRSATSPACPDDIRASLETIAAQCDRIARVVAELLATSRLPRESSVNVCDLVEIAERAVAFMEPECAWRGVSAKLERGGVTAARVELDEERTFQILFNLCLNAIEAQPRGGGVILRILPADGRAEGERHIAFEVEDHPPSIEASPSLSSGHSNARSSSRLLDTSARIERAARDLRLVLARGLVSDTGGSIELMQGSRSGSSIYRVTLRAKEAPLRGAEAVNS